MDEEERERRIHEINERIEEFAKSKSQRVYLEHYRKVLKARLMKQAMVDGHKTTAAQEREAESSDEYDEVLRGLKEATYAETKSYWFLEKSKMEFEAWRTRMATARAEAKRYGAE